MDIQIKKTPTLRFSEFSGVWEKKKLGEVFEFKVTNSFSRDNLNYERGVVKNIHYGDIHTKFQTLFDITKEIVPFINNEMNVIRISDDFYCKEGDIILADASEDLNDVGKSIEIVNLNNEKLLAGLHTLLARPIKFIFAKGYIGQLFKSRTVRLQIQKEAQGTKVLSISTSRISNISILFPTLPEQQKIASFLTMVDEKLQVLKKKKSLLEQYKKGVMQKIFSQEFRFKADNGNDFPKWEVKTLGEITFKVDKKNKHKELLPIYSISNQNGFVPQSEQFEGLDSNDRGYDISLYKIVEKETFAYNPARINVGSIGYSGKEVDRVIISSLYVCFKTNLEIDDKFFLFYLQTEHFKNLVIKKGEGGVRIYLFYENFSEITIDVPFIEEQIKIANFLNAIDEKINHVQGQIQKMELWKKGLLQKMFV